MIKKIGLYVLLLVAQNGAEAAVRNFTLHIDNGSLTITGSGGTALSVWGYGESAGLPTVPAPILTVNEGDTVNVTVYNHRSAQHNFVIKNVTTDATAIAANNGSIYVSLPCSHRETPGNGYVQCDYRTP